MLLVLDVGNTNIVLGIYHGESLLHHWRIETNPRKTSDEYGVLLGDLLASVDIRGCALHAIIISSVVPPMTSILQTALEKYFHKKAFIVHSKVETDLTIQLENPAELGADRMVNAVAGVHEYGAPLVLIDFGTATTYCVIDEKKNYLGGAISPGISVSAEALYTRAAKLPYIQLDVPKQVIGRGTVAAMRSGILFGYVGQVEGIVKRILAECGEGFHPKIVATGGFANLIAGETDAIDVVDPFLTLKGLRLIYEENYGDL